MRQPMERDSGSAARALLLACFFFSGLTALLYQTVWMRLSLAAFGVNSSVVASVLAVFMLGLAAGTVGASRVLALADGRGVGPLRLYGVAEITVGIGGLAVPSLLRAARQVMLSAGPENGVSYTLLTLAFIALILFPFCTAMGLTFPAAVAFLRSAGASGGGRLPFSALYVANVSGALLGAIVTPLVLIEAFGFSATGRAAAVVNGAIAVAAFAGFKAVRLVEDPQSATPAAVRDPASKARRLALFLTGFSTMGMEVIWMRIYPTVIGTFVYSFATILAVYLLATALGSTAYRRLRGNPIAQRMGLWLPWLVPAALLPLFSASSTFLKIPGTPRVFLGLLPFCALLGFVTPALVDREAGDDARRVGSAYGINLLGCLLGPLVAGFVLLPTVGNKVAAVIVAIPLVLLLLPREMRRGASFGSTVSALVAAGLIFASVHLFESDYPASQVRRDHVATVVASGTGMQKRLWVNGVGMTVLTPVTKMMAHYPMAHLRREGTAPLDVLVICFGMGTTFRSLASWGANVTAVELVPSVPEMFGYFHEDGPALVRQSGGRLRIVHDDGRRFLDRSHQRFDLITIDPPPPVEAAGSSLLYTKEFYESAKRKMKPGAILQTWLPEGDYDTVTAVMLSVKQSFPYVRVGASIVGGGYHITASNDPIPELTAEQLLARMPEAAVRDMTEWETVPAVRYFDAMLRSIYDVDGLLAGNNGPKPTQPITDDHPVNEFYFMRRLKAAPSLWAALGGTIPPAAAAPR